MFISHGIVSVAVVIIATTALSMPQMTIGFTITSSPCRRHGVLLPFKSKLALRMVNDDDSSSSSDAPFFSMLDFSSSGNKKDQESSAITNKDSNVSASASANEMTDIEKEVLAAAQAKLDVKRVKKALLGRANTVVFNDETDDELASSVAEPIAPPPSQNSIALAAASFLGLLSFLTLQIPLLSLVVFLATGYIASRDPMNDEELVEGDISGPVTRIVGRAALKSIEKSKPTVQRVVRAVVSEDEFDKLQMKYLELEKENQEIKREVEVREAVEAQAKKFSMTELKDIAKKNDVKAGGTKVQLMTRLVEGGFLNLLGD